MKNKIIIILICIFLIEIIFIYSQKIQINYLKDSNKILEKKIKLISKKSKDNILDLEKRNEELKIKNDEIIELYKITENISKTSNSKDCINSPINDNIKLLLQKENIL